ncbi:CLUMA_CG012023, isoform A [Gryllus bimaculatus]|nr:CLUMA_CG012023, isoform A [Gryllus bimaculatus]
MLIFLNRWVFLRAFNIRHVSSRVCISEEVRNALNKNMPVVALETALVTHGMPHPENIKTAIAAQDAVSSQGAVPATIAILHGRVKVGLLNDELVELAEGKAPSIKISRRDFPYAISKKINGGTTVSGTMAIADLVGIRIFATGGIGGVHRGGESTFDISADLTELGRTPVAVVSSGVKAILDIPRTLEFLETQGVCVAALGAPGSSFPAFYSQGSGHKAPLCVSSPEEAAGLLHSLTDLGLRSGMLLAVPVPSEHALPDAMVEDAVGNALKEAEAMGIQGKDITPFLLQRISQSTKGHALVANQSLIINNAKIAAQMAVEFEKLQKTSF